MALRNYSTVMSDGGGGRRTTTTTRSTATTRPTTTTTKSTTTKTSNNKSGGFFSKVGQAISNWADKLVSNNQNIGKGSGVENASTWAGLVDESFLPTTTSTSTKGSTSSNGSSWADRIISNNPNFGKNSGVENASTWAGLVDESLSPTSTSNSAVTTKKNTGSTSGSKTTATGGGIGPVYSSVNNLIDNAINNNKSSVSTTATQSPNISTTQAQANNSGTLDTKAGVGTGSSGVITDLPTATQSTSPGTLIGQYLLDQLADIKGTTTEQGSSGTATSSVNAAEAKDQAEAEEQAEEEQNAAFGLKAWLNRLFGNNKNNEGLPAVPNQGYDPYAYSTLTPTQALIADRIKEQAAGRQRRAAEAEEAAALQPKLQEEAMNAQYLDDFVNGKFAGDWGAFERAIKGSDIEDLLNPDPNKNLGGGIGPVYSSVHSDDSVDIASLSDELMNLANKYYAEGGTYSPFGGTAANDVAYTVAAAEDNNNPGTYLSWGSAPLQTTNGQTTDLSGTRSYVAGDPDSYGYATSEGLVPLQGNGLPDNAAISSLNALANSGEWVPNGQPAAPESLVKDLATMLANAGVTGESSDNSSGGGSSGGGSSGGGSSGGGGSGNSGAYYGGGGNSGTYYGGGNVATNTTENATNDYLYTLPEVSNSVTGALLNRLLPTGYDYNYNSRLQSRLGDIQAAENYYRNGALQTLQNVYQNQAANTLANMIQAMRANNQSGLTDRANRGLTAAANAQALIGANKENSENLNNTVGTNLASMLSTLTNKRATAGSDTSSELQPYTTSMDNALSQVLMYYLYGNAAAEVNNGGLNRQNTVNYTAV